MKVHTPVLSHELPVLTVYPALVSMRQDPFIIEHGALSAERVRTVPRPSRQRRFFTTSLSTPYHAQDQVRIFPAGEPLPEVMK